MTPSPGRLVGVLLLAGAVLASCVAEPPAGGTAVAADDARSQAEPLDIAVATARADLAARLDLAGEMIDVVEARSVTWASGDLGCPEPGMSYPQVLTPGVLVVLSAGGARYHYHGGRGGAPAYCPEDRIRPPVQGGESDRWK
ncbi:MAG TPA: hypothetical protein VMQ83_04875 [Gammaproteobacteria bacterium]|nr:hypothetical protein [Gammaproteobacteria bacterium]